MSVSIKETHKKVADAIWAKLFNDEYLFSWDDVLRGDSKRLIKSLKGSLKINWVKNAKIKKIDDNTITVTGEKNSLTLRLNKGKNTVTLETDGGVTYIYAYIYDIFKAKNEKLKNVYTVIIKFADCLMGMSPEMQEYALGELPEHLVDAKQLKRLHHLLTNLYFIEAKCAAGMIYDLVADYGAALDVLPEAQEEKQKELEHERCLKQYTEDMITYAKAWNDARERHAIDPENNPMPDLEDIPLPEIIPSVESWSDEKIRKDTKRIINNPTRLDRIRAFSQFVNSESQGLVKFGSMPGFCLQQAYNYVSSSPVARAAEDIINVRFDEVFLLQSPLQRPDYNPQPALLKTLEGHTDSVNRVIITADGKKAISGSFDNSLRVWDLEIGQCLRTFEEFTFVFSATPDGKKAIATKGDGILRILDLESGECVQIIKGHKGGVAHLCITPDGRKAISGGGGTLWVWDLGSGECVREIKIGYSIFDRVEILCISANGKRAVSALSTSRTLELWDLGTGKCIRTLGKQQYFVDCVSITPDGKLAVSGDYNILRVWDLETGKCLRTLEGHKSSVNSISITPDGKRVVSGEGGLGESDNVLRIWDLESGKCLKTLRGHTDWVYAVSITPDGRKAVSGGNDNTLRVWNLESRESPKTLHGHTSLIFGLSIAPNGNKVISGSRDKTLRVWDMRNGKCIGTMEGHIDQVLGVSFTPDSKKVVSHSTDKTLRVWDIENVECLKMLKGHTKYVRCMSITPDGSRILSGGTQDSTGSDTTLRVWDLESGECLKILEGHIDDIICLTVTADGKKVISGGRVIDKTLRVWDVESGECLRIFKGHTDDINSISATPDGKIVVSGSGSFRQVSDNVIKIWDLESGRCLRTLRGHTAEIRCVSVTPDGREVVSGSKDKIRVWNLRNGECLRTFEEHTQSVKAVNVTPDGKRAISISEDKSARVWNLETGECIAVYQARDKLYSLSKIRTSGHFGIGTQEGEVIFLTIHNMPMEPPLVTPHRIWLYGDKGRWEDDIKATCQWCGQRFPVPDEILDVITAIARDANISPDQSPCLELPNEAWNNPHLLSECPLCHKPLRFNPFLVDNRGR